MKLLKGTGVAGGDWLNHWLGTAPDDEKFKLGNAAPSAARRSSGYLIANVR